MEVIKADDLSFSYEREPILDKISFSIYGGDFAAIMGSNGTGKSTLLKLLLSEYTPVSGTVHWFGYEMRNFKDWSKIGYVPQHNILMGNSFPASVSEIVKANLFSEIGFLRFPKKHHAEKTMEALKQVHMEDYAKCLIGNLSGGQQQKVMMARALVSEPEILILDEPTTGIDAKSCKELYSILGRLNQEKKVTILIITHDVGSVSKYITRGFYMDNSQIFELSPDRLSSLEYPDFIRDKKVI